MAKYRAFINAVQWIGTNVTEIRQFIRASGGVINDASITNGVLTLHQAAGGELRPDVPIPVLVSEWAIINGTTVSKATNAAFVAQYEVDP